MSRNSGYLVDYEDKEGKIQKAQLLYKDQEKAFKDKEKALVTLLNDDLTLKLDEKNQPIRILKALSLLTIKGYTD